MRFMVAVRVPTTATTDAIRPLAAIPIGAQHQTGLVRLMQFSA